MKKILVLFAHPSYERSAVNRAMLEAITSLDGVTVHDLYQQYPNFSINVANEQALAEQHDIIIFQHPFFWYSTPALLKEWQDLVLTEEWAYDFNATGLKDKTFLVATTCGGPEETYTATGYNRFSIFELLRPIEQMAQLCHMQYIEPFVIYGTGNLSAAERTQEAERYRQRLLALRDQ